MTYDHTDADVAMMRHRAKLNLREKMLIVLGRELFSGLDEPVRGTVNYDEDGHVYTTMYPALPCF